MIVAKIMGGLANQMFEYAAGRSLADKRKTDLKLDAISYYKSQPQVDTPRHYELEVYNIAADKVSTSELENILNAGQSQPKGLKRLFAKPQGFTIYNEPSLAFQPGLLKLPDNTYLNGYFQNEKYFTDVRDKLTTDFTPKKLSASTKKTIDKITATNSVSIHVRRGDYIKNQAANKFHGTMPVSYYESGLRQVQKKVKDVTVFVFSDDIEWCKKNLKFKAPTVFVENDAPACEEIYIMQHSSHNIIANSSFSWWGAWLNQNPSKIVIAPKMWFRDEKQNKVMELPKEWIRL